MTSVYEDPTTWRLKTADRHQVPYRIVGMAGNFEPERADAQVEMLIPANRLIDFVNAMFPPVIILPVSGFPIYPARGRILNTPLQAVRISWRAHIDGLPIDPFGVDSEAPEGTYQQVCSCSVDFATINGNEDNSDPENPETFLTVTCNGAGEVLVTDGAKSAVDPALSEEEGMAIDALEDSPKDPQMMIMVPQFEWSASWPRVPAAYYRSVIRPRLKAAIGRVNSVTMPLFGNAPPETILFVGFSSSVGYTWRSPADQFVQLNLKFLEKNVGLDERTGAPANSYIGHNHFWQPGVGWAKLKVRLKPGSDPQPVYPEYDLRLIYSS
jgi:hypothetical protein